MFSKRVSVEDNRKLSKWTTKLIDYKLDTTARVSLLRKIAEVRSFGMEITIIWLQLLQNANDKYSTFLVTCIFNDLHPYFKNITQNIPPDFFSIDNIDGYRKTAETSSAKNCATIFWDSPCAFAPTLGDRAVVASQQVPSNYIEKFLFYTTNSLYNITSEGSIHFDKCLEAIIVILRDDIWIPLFQICPSVEIEYFKSDNIFDFYKQKCIQEDSTPSSAIYLCRDIITKWILSYLIKLFKLDEEDDVFKSEDQLNSKTPTPNPESGTSETHTPRGDNLQEALSSEAIPTSDSNNEHQIRVGELIREIIFKSYQNLAVVLEIFRFNLSSYNVSIKNKKAIVYLLDHWSMPEYAPPFVTETDTPLDQLNLKSNCEIYHQRFFQILYYISLIPFYSASNQDILSIIPSLRISLSFVRTFATSRSVYIKSESWLLLLEALIDVFSTFICSKSLNTPNQLPSNDSSFLQFASYFFQSIFLIWLRGNIYSTVPSSLWNKFTDILKNTLYHNQLFEQWFTSLEIITRLYCVEAYKVDILNLPLEKEVDTRRKIKDLSKGKNKNTNLTHRYSQSVVKFITDLMDEHTKNTKKSNLDPPYGDKKSLFSETSLDPRVRISETKHSAVDLDIQEETRNSGDLSTEEISGDVKKGSLDAPPFDCTTSSYSHDSASISQPPNLNFNPLNAMDSTSFADSEIDKETLAVEKFNDLCNNETFISQDHLFLIWNRFVGLFGNLNDLKNDKLQLLVIKTYIKIFDILEDVVKNQGIGSDLKFTFPLNENRPNLHYFSPTLLDFLAKNPNLDNLILLEANTLLIRAFFSPYNFPKISDDLLIAYLQMFLDILTSKNSYQMLQFFKYAENIMNLKIEGTNILIKPILKSAQFLLTSKIDSPSLATVLLSMCSSFFYFSHLKLQTEPPSVLSDVESEYFGLIVTGATSCKDASTRCIFLSAINLIILENVYKNTNHFLVKFFLTVLLKHLFSKSISVVAFVCSLLICYHSLFELFDKFNPFLLEEVFSYVSFSINFILNRHKNSSQKFMLYNNLINMLNLLLELLFKKPSPNNIQKLIERLDLISAENVQFNLSSINLYQNLYPDTCFENIDDSLKNSLESICDVELDSKSDISTSQSRETPSMPAKDSKESAERELSFYFHVKYIGDLCLLLLKNFPLPVGATILFSGVPEGEVFVGENLTEPELNCFIFSVKNRFIMTVFELNSSDPVNEKFKPYLDPPNKTQLLFIFRTAFGKFSWICSEISGTPEKIQNNQLNSLRVSHKMRQFSSNSDPLWVVFRECTIQYPALLNDLPFTEKSSVAPSEVNSQVKIDDHIKKNASDVSIEVKLMSKTDPSPTATFKHQLLMQLTSQLGYFFSENRSHINVIQPTTKFFREIRQFDGRLIRSTHKIAIFYVKEGQEDKESILLNSTTSPKFNNFLSGLGWVIDLEQHKGFFGGLDKSNIKNCSTVYFCSLSNEIIFHIAPMMPILESTNALISKMRHLGNDEIQIVWSEHYRPFRRGIINTEFGDVIIVIYPLPNQLYEISILRRPGITIVGPLLNGAIVSLEMLPILIRETVINYSHLIRMKHELYKTSFEDRLNVIRQVHEKFGSKCSFEEYLSSIMCTR